MLVIRSLKLSFFMLLCLQLGVSVFVANGKCSTEKDYILGVGDILKIEVWGNDDLNRTVEISQEGAFSYPLIGKINARGLSVFEAESLLKQKLGDGYLVAPQLSVSVKEYKSQKIFIFGEVKKPGTYIIKGAMPLLEVISMADGLTEKASQMVRIVRHLNLGSKLREASPGQQLPVEQIDNIDLRKIANGTGDREVLVGRSDSIYVGKKEQIFIIGEVKNPGRIEWQDGLTIHQAISIAGGPTKRASMRRTKVVRVIGGKEKALSLDMSETAKPDDIIKVPESYF